MKFQTKKITELRVTHATHQKDTGLIFLTHTDFLQKK